MLSAGLAGEAWGEVEHFAADELMKGDAAKVLISSLRRRFDIDDWAELADDFDEYVSI